MAPVATRGFFNVPSQTYAQNNVNLALQVQQELGELIQETQKLEESNPQMYQQMPNRDQELKQQVAGLNQNQRDVAVEQKFADMSIILNLKPSDTAIKIYYQKLARIQKIGYDNERTIRRPFDNLLDYCCDRFNWLLVTEEYVILNDTKCIPDGFIENNNNTVHGIYEAKDTKDKLETEINKKFAKGYPKDNILFWSPKQLIIYQNNELVFDKQIDTDANANNLILGLKQFFEYIKPKTKTSEKFITKKEKIDNYNSFIKKLNEEEKIAEAKAIFNANDITEEEYKQLQVAHKDYLNQNQQRELLKYALKSKLPDIDKSDIWSANLVKNLLIDNPKKINWFLRIIQLKFPSIAITQEFNEWINLELKNKQLGLQDIEYNAAATEILKNLKITELIENELLMFSEGDERLKELCEKCKNKRIEQILNLKVGKQSCVRFFGLLISKYFGFGLTQSRPFNKDRGQFYQYTIKKHDDYESLIICECLWKKLEKVLEKSENIDKHQLLRIIKDFLGLAG